MVLRRFKDYSVMLSPPILGSGKGFIMTRTASFAAIGILACGYVLAAPRPETSTYVDGNVASLKPNTGGALVFSDDKAILFRTGLIEVAMPYASILKAELGATKLHSHDAPAYKVWTRLHKTETQLLTVEFKNDGGEDRTVTFELAKPAASSVLATIQEHTPAILAASSTGTKGAATNGTAWWGDGYWKTKQNLDTWTRAGATSGSK
jgi:hypothetical protein